MTMGGRPRRSVERSHGVTLVELMVALAIGLLVIMFVASVYLAQLRSARTSDDDARIQEVARIGIGALERTLRLAGYVDWAGAGGAPPSYCDFSSTTSDDGEGAAIVGPFVEGREGTGHMFSSDRIVIRFYGSGSETQLTGDGGIRDCRGVSVPSVSLAQNTVNTYYVGADADGEPALFCRSRMPSGEGLIDDVPLIPGVESFQVMYLLSDGVSVAPRRYVQAGEVTDWRSVVAVRIGLLLRGDTRSRADQDFRVYDLFDPTYSASNPADVSARFDAKSALSEPDRYRLRRTFATTVEFRNGPIATCRGRT